MAAAHGARLLRRAEEAPGHRAYALADNKLAENAGWDRKLLALELRYVAELDIDFDLTLTGFETADSSCCSKPSTRRGGGGGPGRCPA